MNKKLRFATMILAAALLLAACIPATGSDGATIDATQAAQLVETAVVQALNAQATQMAANVPAATATPLPPTNTPIPAPATETLVPTITPVVLAPTTAPSSGGTGGTTVKVYEFACDPDVGKRPYDNSEFKGGDTFDIKFTIVNTGTETWPNGYDLVLITGNNYVDLTNGGYTTVQLPEVPPGGSYSVGPYDAWAPNGKGNYVMAFKLEGGFCFPYVSINVK